MGNHTQMAHSSYTTLSLCNTRDGTIIDRTPGFYDKSEKVDTYDPHALHYWGQWLTAYIQTGRIVQSTFCAGITLMVGLLWGDTPGYVLSASGIQAAVGSVQTLVSFLLGGYCSLVVSRWLSRRSTYIALVGGLKSLLIMVAGVVHPHEQGEPELERSKMATALRRTITRYASLMLELAVLEARGQMEESIGKGWLEQQGLLTGEAEWALMCPGQRHLSVLSWLNHSLSKSVAQGLVSADEHAQLMTLMVTVRSNTNDMMNCTVLDLPLPYVHILIYSTKIWILIYSINFGTMGIDSEGNRSTTWVVISAVFCFWFNFVLQALLDLQHQLNNPFLDGQLCVPHEGIYKGFKQLAGCLLAQSEQTMKVDGTWSGQMLSQQHHQSACSFESGMGKYDYKNTGEGLPVH